MQNFNEKLYFYDSSRPLIDSLFYYEIFYDTELSTPMIFVLFTTTINWCPIPHNVIVISKEDCGQQCLQMNLATATDQSPFSMIIRMLGGWWRNWYCIVVGQHLTHLPLNKMAAILQMIFSDAFSWMKSFAFWWRFHWSLFLRVQLAITQKLCCNEYPMESYIISTY